MNDDGGDDLDGSGGTISYSCSWDNTDNDSEDAANSCSSSGFSFNTSTGVLSGTPTSAGIYEFKIIGTSSGGSDSVFFTVSISAIPGVSATEEWVKVPSNAGSMGLTEFRVMKYEAKAWSDANSDGKIDSGEVDADGCNEGSCTTGNWGLATNWPVSIADGQPWRKIGAGSAAAECESLGAGYAIISNAEWMAIARDVEIEDQNWTEGAVGSGCLFTGNSGDATCGYDSATDPDSGTGRNARAKLILSSDNTQEIYDLAGNVEEFVDRDDPTSPTAGFQVGSECSFEQSQLPNVSCNVLVDADYNTSNSGYTTAQGVGLFYSDHFGALAIRGGSWYSGGAGGVFRLDLRDASPTYSSSAIGFRCVYRP